MANSLEQYCENILVIFESEVRAMRALRHPMTAAFAREKQIRDFLSEHLPELVTVVTGIVIDTEDTASSQQDVVLRLKSMPRLPIPGGTEIVFQEGVVATLEIKTSLGIESLSSIGKNFASVRALKSAVGVTSEIGVTHQWPATRILAGVVTYEGPRFEILIAALARLPDEQRPDVVLDLSRGILVRNNGFLLTKGGPGEYLEIASPAKGLKMFFTFLTEISGTLAARGVAWRNYW